MQRKRIEHENHHLINVPNKQIFKQRPKNNLLNLFQTIIPSKKKEERSLNLKNCHNYSNPNNYKTYFRNFKNV